MKRLFTLAILLCTIGLVSAHSRPDTLGIGGRINFVENLGQQDSHVKYEAQMGRAALFLEQKCFTIAIREVIPQKDGQPFHHNIFGPHGHAYKLHFVGCNPDVQLAGEDRKPGYNNYYRGKDKNKWRSHVNSYGRIRYEQLWIGIDMEVYSAQNALKYDFIVTPNTDPDVIVMSYEGQDGLRLEDGNIIVKTSVGQIVELAPYAYQIINGDTVHIEAQYVLKKKRITFRLGNYDRSKTLIIDPQLYFSTYTGSTADNWGTTATYDSYKNTYTGGIVFGLGYPTSVGAFDTTFHGNVDVAIFKFDTTGSERMFATYLGGSEAVACLLIVSTNSSCLALLAPLISRLPKMPS